MNIVILTGAGISAESGIKTFRDANGLWENHAIEDVATPEAYQRNPALVQQFYNARRAQLLDPRVQPNAAHHALVKLEQNWPGDFLLVTQNVDDLHSRAGSKKLVHMHGELLKARCIKTGAVQDCREDLNVECGLRPHIVWFGEIPFELDRIFSALGECDLFLSIGTSGQVYPAAGFVSAAKSNGRARVQAIEVNPDASANHSLFDRAIRATATSGVPSLVDELLALV